MIVTDLHVHPSPWRNGPGAFRSFVRAAIAKGVDVLGFCEHGPSVHKDPRYRGLDERGIEEYAAQVRSLKDEFKGILQIFCGLELDYAPANLERYQHIREDFPLDYFLVSVHIIDDWHLDTPDSLHTSMHRGKTEEELYRLYFGRIAEAIETDLCDGLAHLDYYRRSLPHPPGQPPEFAGEIFEDIAASVAAKDVAVEVNTRGLKREVMREVHPTKPLLKYLIRAGARLMLGSDAHEVESVGSNIRETRRMLLREGVTGISYFRDHRALEIGL